MFEFEKNWGYSSVGRALLLHGRCQRFESAYLQTIKKYNTFYFKNKKL